MIKLKHLVAAVGITGLILTQASSIQKPNYHMRKAYAENQEIVGHFETLEQLEDIIANNENVAVDISETWCKPCKRYKLVFKAIAEEYKGKVVFYKVDMDEMEHKEKRKLIDEYDVEYIPKTLLFKNGKEVYRHEGFLEKKELKGLIEKYLIGE